MKIKHMSYTALAMVMAVQAGIADAQEAPSNPSADSVSAIDDIVVTARRRNEKLDSVPVAVTSITGEILSRRGITNFEGFARTVPNLFLANSSGSIQGGAIGLRGISAGDGNVFGDQAVAFNIDGILIARASPRRLAQFDLAQIDVLKGPQALFYGKNSPGGVIAVRTADPTDELQMGGKIGYEFNGHEVNGDVFLSGPITEKLLGRVAVYAAHRRGWVHDITTPGTIYSPTSEWIGKTDEFGGRVTLKYDGGPFQARFKANYAYQKDDGQFANAQRFACPTGAPQMGGGDDCRANDTQVRAWLGTKFSTGGTNTVSGAPIPGMPFFGDGVPYSKTRQYLTGLETTYEVADGLTVASNTGYYYVKINTLDNISPIDSTSPFNPAAVGGAAGAGGIVAGFNDLRIREFSQELRLTSDFSGPFNFMLGAYYQHQSISYLVATEVNALNPIALHPPADFRQKNDAISPFANVLLKPLPAVEISAGVRYSHEDKTIAIYRALPGSFGGVPYTAGTQITTAVPNRKFSNWSPEVTLSYHPTSDSTIYGGWRRGFLSGGFNASALATRAATIGDLSYGQQIVEGFEGGVKFATPNRALRLNLAAYSYKVKGLQVTAQVGLVQSVTNAAAARSKGVEASAEVRTPIHGLNLHGSVAYNDAHYTNYVTAPCYNAQTIAQGCNLNLLSGQFRNQDLSGTPLVRAPKWGGSVGGTFEVPLASADKLTLSMDANFTGRFFSEAVGNPDSYQKSYALLDGSVKYDIGGKYTLSLIGRNLTNKYYVQRSTSVLLAGTASGFATSVGADQVGWVSRGREIWVQAGVKF